EAFAYARQTLGYPAPVDLGPAQTPRAGAFPGDVAVPGGTWQLGSTAADGFVFDNEKWAHAVELEPFCIAKAPVTNAEYAAFVEAGGDRTPASCGEGRRGRRAAIAPASFGARKAGPGGSPRVPNDRSIGCRSGTVPGHGAATMRPKRLRPTRRSPSSIGTRRRPGAAGRDVGCRARRSGKPP